ncbi:hypothetical protein [Geodermatophilus sp. URMC 62]|uniref:hypothetical protein n=1 Tax=Geodermatophilus sp. URMC 62 TaxID=3423414 RepID=UPI00406D196F
MFEDQYVELLPARTTMQVTVGGFGGAGGAGGAGGGGLALSLAANVAVVTQNSTAISLFGDAVATNEVTTGDATSGAADAAGGAGGDGGLGGGGIEG